MNKIYLTFIFIFTVLISGISQEIATPKKNQYTFNGSTVKLRDMFQIMEQYPEPLQELKSARVQKIFSYVTAGAGGWVLGRMLGKAIGGNYTDALIDEIGIGAGLIGLTFIFDSGSKKRIRKAVDLYNSTVVTQSSNNNETSLEFNVTNNGIGFLVHF